MSTQQNKFQKERAQKELLELANSPGNNICADCKARQPRWASHNLGIFICQNCASIHRKIGTHITKVKSLTMDEWTKEQIETMRSKGNIKSNSIYNPNEIRNPPPPNIEDTERDSEIEQYIRAKYEYRRFIDKSALVASKLGPSRSVSSVIVPQPATNSSQSTSSQQQPTAARSTGFITSRVPVNLLAQQIPQLPPRPTEPASKTTKSTTSAFPPEFTQPAKKTTSNPLEHSIWADLNSLNTPSQDSSLPLQYQQPTINGSAAYNSGVLSAGSGINPYSRDQYTEGNVYPQQQQPFQTSTQFSSSPSVPSGLTQPQSFNQYLGTSPSNNSMLSQSPSTNFFHPQASQSSLQAQSPATHNFLSPSPSQSYVPNSTTTQQQFLTPSPNQQFLSQPQMQHSPHIPGQGQGQFMFQNQAPVSPQIPFGMNNQSSPAQSQFLGMTTMQMQQQALLMQQQQQLQQQQFQQFQQQQQLQQMQQLSQGGYGNPQSQMQYGQQMYPQGGYSSQGNQQWGAM